MPCGPWPHRFPADSPWPASEPAIQRARVGGRMIPQTLMDVRDLSSPRLMLRSATAVLRDAPCGRPQDEAAARLEARGLTGWRGQAPHGEVVLMRFVPVLAGPCIDDKGHAQLDRGQGGFL